MSSFLRAALEVVYGTQDIWVGLPYVLIAAAIFIGGCIGVYVLSYGIDYILLGVERANQYVRTSKRGDWQPRPKRSCRNVRHLVTIILFFSGLAMVLWISIASAGFNVWSTSMTALGMSVIATYVFSSSLVKLGNALTLHFNNAIEVGQHWEFHGMGPGWDGIITSITSIDVEMSHWDEESQCTEAIKVPIEAFASQWRKTNSVKQERLQKMHLVATIQELQEMELAAAAQKPPPSTAPRLAPATSGSYIGRVSHTEPSNKKHPYSQAYGKPHNI